MASSAGQDRRCGRQHPGNPDGWFSYQVRCDTVGEYPVVINRDRQSTRLNSSHVKISYAVFCRLPRCTLFPYTTLFRSYLCICNNHSELKRIMRDTQWAAGWRRVLARLDGVDGSTRVIRMAGSVTRCVAIPLASIQ